MDEQTMKEKVDEMHSILKPAEIEKKGLFGSRKKKLKLPRRAKVSRSRMKKGYCGTLFLNENRVISGEKVKLEGGTFQTKDKNYHVTNGKELFFWEGKHPVLFQRYDKLNPTDLLRKEGELNEIYGQDLVMLRMKRDLVKEKGKVGFGWIYIVIILIGGYFILKAFFPNLFGG